jgi:ABC-type lipopolysaccharide export system ATPase subunit
MQANISKMPIHSRAKLGLSYLPQEPSIFRKMTVAENILAIFHSYSFQSNVCLRRKFRVKKSLNIPK